MEYKDFSLSLEVAAQDGTFSGYASVFNVVDQGKDIVMPTAFDASFNEGMRKPKMLWQHNPNQPCGVWQKMTKDEHGLKVEGKLLLDSIYGKEVYALLHGGAVDGLSIGYKTEDYDFQELNGETVRRILKATLWEVSVVTFPMNTEALVTDVKQLQGPREVEQLLHKAGVPGNFAKLVALYGFDEAKRRLSSDQREVDAEGKKQLETLMKEIQQLKETLNGW